MSSSIPNVVVIGGSYVGLNLGESLASHTSTNKFRILLVEKNSHFQHLFAFPRYAVTTQVDTHKAFIPYQSHRLGENGAVLQATAVSISGEQVTLDREVEIDGVKTRNVPFKALAIATGTRLAPPSTLSGSEKKEGTAYLIEHAQRVEASARIVIIGGGAVGVQMATDIAQLHPDKEVTLIHSRRNLMSKFHSGLHDIVAARLEELGVRTVLGQRVVVPAGGFPATGSFSVELQDGTSVAADVAIVSTGQTPRSDLIASLDASCIDESGFIKVKDTLQIASSAASYPGIFALGDVAATKAHKAARPAMKQAEVVASNILNLLGGGGEMQDYTTTDPAAIHLTLGIEKSVIFRNPRGDGTQGGEEPVVMHKDDGRLDMGIDGVWGRRGADVSAPML